MGRRARAASDFAGDLLKYLLDFDFIKKQNVKDEAEDMAKYILMQRSQGKANLIDDWDMKQADDQFLYDFTPLHMNTQDRLKEQVTLDLKVHIYMVQMKNLFKQ